MRIELIWAYRGRQVIVRENGRFVAEGLLNDVDLVSVPVPRTMERDGGPSRRSCSW